MSSPYFFFRPILAADRRWSAFDWQSGASFTEQGSALLHGFAESAAEPLARQLPVLVPVDPASLEESEFIDGFSASPVIFVLPGASLDNAQTMERCQHLHRKGRRFGLQLANGAILRKVPVATFDCLSFDAAFARQKLSLFDLAYARNAGFRKIATNVGSHEMFTWLTDKGVEWCDSHFLTTRDPLRGKEPDLTRLKLLKLLTLVRNDGDTREIEGVFREEAKLSYNLLRLVNSVAVGARTKISSFSQAIAILGRRQLQRWLQLLIYANNLADGNAPNPLMQIAAARGRQMELLSAAVEPLPSIPDLSDNAFMTGLFSLLEVLINLPMTEILGELPMQEEVVRALISPTQDGILGQLLSAIIASEAGDFSDAAAILSALGISPETHGAAQATAFYWASRIDIENSN